MTLAPSAASECKSFIAPEVPELHQRSTPSRPNSSRESSRGVLCRLYVECYENQRWFPVVGWGTSRLPLDPPNFSSVTLTRDAEETDGRTHEWATFSEAFAKVNHVSFHRDAASNCCSTKCLPVRAPLMVVLPDGYAWDGYWEVYKDNPSATDPEGWRYALDFPSEMSSEATTLGQSSNFKSTQMPTSVVRRRVWRRYVCFAKIRGPTAPSPTLSKIAPHSPPITDGLDTVEEEIAEDEAVALYLRAKQEEMGLAEKLKARRVDTLARGLEWTTEADLAAEEELRSFTREQRAHMQESVTNRVQSNLCCENPFQTEEAEEESQGPTFCHVDTATLDDAPSDSQLRYRHSGAVAASSWAADSRTAVSSFCTKQTTGNTDREINWCDLDSAQELHRASVEEENLKYSFARTAGGQSFVAESSQDISLFPSVHALREDKGSPEAVHFVETMSSEDKGANGGAVDESINSDGCSGPSPDFEDIFQKFVANPETYISLSPRET